MSAPTEIFKLARKLTSYADDKPSKSLDDLGEAASEVSKAWSGSWMGYHSRVYYDQLKPIPPGARFSVEWGLMETMTRMGTVGEWYECDFQHVVDEIQRRAGVSGSEIDKLKKKAKDVASFMEDAQSDLLSILTSIAGDHKSDDFLNDLVKKIREEQVFSYSDIIEHFSPTGQVITRDMGALGERNKVPPHITVLAEVGVIESPYNSCLSLGKLARRAASHIENTAKKDAVSDRVGTNVFIGHGRSSAWRDLKDFVQERLRLPWDEFNRVSVAGLPNTVRLSQMLDSAAVAFIILTAEDEQRDGKMHARMNVIHEAGLFQGRLGFEKAILLLEEGCEEFSNVEGLGQIRFPSGNISAKFEDIRRVLEREGLVEPSDNKV